MRGAIRALDDRRAALRLAAWAMENDLVKAEPARVRNFLLEIHDMDSKTGASIVSAARIGRDDVMRRLSERARVRLARELARLASRDPGT